MNRNTNTGTPEHWQTGRVPGDIDGTGMQQQDAPGVGYGHDINGAPPHYDSSTRADVAGSRGGVGNLTKNPRGPTDMGPIDSSAQTGTGTGVPPSGLRGLHYGMDAATGYAGPGSVPGAGAAGTGASYEHDVQHGQGHPGDPRAQRPGSGAGAKATTGQRIVGEIEKFAGKMMEDPEMVVGKQRTAGQIPAGKNPAGATGHTDPNAQKF